MSGSLAGCRAKIERAKQHIHDLNTTIVAFFDTKPYVVGTKRNPDTRQLIYYVVSVPDTPPTILTIAGDVFQNLRSALDHLAYQLVFVGTKGRGPFEHVYFPARFNSASEYESKRMGQVQGMRQEAIKAIDAIEPYQGGKGDILWRLHQLNNIDKHRLLLTVGSNFGSVNVGPLVMHLFQNAPAWAKDIPPINVSITPANRLCPLKAGDELFIDGPDAEVNEKMKFALHIALSEPKIAEAEPLIELLQQMTDFIDNLISAFEPLLV